jgi:endonuclease I
MRMFAWPHSRVTQARISLLVVLWAVFLNSGSTTAASCDDADSSYSGFAWGNATQASLRLFLHRTASAGHVPVTYSATYSLLEQIDAHNTTAVRLAYGSFGGKCRTETHYGRECVWNREHLWPQSFGVGESSGLSYDAPPRVDMHALVPSHYSLNSARSNRVFKQITTEDDTTCAACCINWSNGATCESPVATATTVGAFGSASIGGNWQPPPEMRGFVARAMMYMALRYDGNDDGTFELRLAQSASKPGTVADGGANQTYFSFGVLSDLLLWHRNHPVAEWERVRNTAVCNAQGNRNPFTDHPEVVETVFGTAEEAELGIDTWSVGWSGEDESGTGLGRARTWTVFFAAYLYAFIT